MPELTDLQNTGVIDHAARHATGGPDAITPASIGAAKEAQGILADNVDARFKAIFRSDNSRVKTTLSKIKAGTKKSMTNLMIGDSLANKVAELLDYNYFREWFPADTTPIVNDVGGGSSSGAIGGQGLVGSGGTLNVKTDYDYSFDGTNYEITAGQHVIWSYNGTFGTKADRIIIPYIIEAGAGTFKVLASVGNAGVTNPADASWVNPLLADIETAQTLTGGELIVDASAGTAGQLGIIILTYDTTTTRSVQVVHESGGNVRTIRPMFQVLQSEAVNSYRLLEGSNAGTVATAASAVPMGQLIAALDPDLITFQEDDPASSIQNFAPILNDALVNAAQSHPASVWLIGNGPRILSDMVAQNLAYYEQAANYKWFSYGGTEIVDTKEKIESYGWGGSGNTDFIHLSAEFYTMLADQLAALAGVEPPPPIVPDVNSFVTLDDARDTIWAYFRQMIEIPVGDSNQLNYTLSGSATSSSFVGIGGAAMRVTNVGPGTGKGVTKQTPNIGGSWNTVDNLDFNQAFRLSLQWHINDFSSAGGTNKARIKIGAVTDAIGDLSSANKAIALYVDETGNLSFAYADLAAPVVTSLATNVFNSSGQAFIEIHSDGIGNYKIYKDSVLLNTIANGPMSSSSNASFIWEIDCPTAPTVTTDIGLLAPPRFVFFN